MDGTPFGDTQPHPSSFSDRGGSFRYQITGLRGKRADLAAFLAGLIAALALPPIHVVPVLLLSVPMLLLLIDGSRGFWVAVRRGWWFGFGLYLVGLYWITEAILIESARLWWCVPLAVPALSALLAAFVAAAVGVARFARPGWPRWAALAGAWVLADLARQFVGTGFPWNLWGSVWELPGRAGDVMIQPAALVGVHGLTLATVLLAGLPLLNWWFRAAGVALLSAWVGFGLVRVGAPPPQTTGITAVLVQGDIAEGQKWSQVLAAGIFRRYLDLTREGVARAGHGPRVVIWPETAFPGLLARDSQARRMIVEATGGTPSLIGSVRFGADGRPRNSLFALTGTGDIAAVYDKWHLVPFGEYQPSWFPFVQVVPGGGFAAGPGPETLHMPGLPSFGPIICYEAIFPSQVVDESDRPHWIVNITNDAWFGNSTGPRQHLAAARMRAVEEGLPLLRAANTGITAGFDARGHEIARLAMNRPGTLVLPLPGALPPTPYARMGLSLPIALSTLTLLSGLLASVRWRRHRLA